MHGRGAAGGGDGDAVYHFDKADVVVSLDADFLTCGPGSVRYQKDFAAHRRVSEDNQQMSRLYSVESTPTLTGVKADHRLAMKASEVEGFGRQLAGAVGAAAPAGAGGGTTDPASAAGKWVAAIAKDLQARRGRSLVVPGEYQTAAVHAIARSINQTLGNVGSTVTYGPAVEAAPTNQSASLADLVHAMDAGQVEVLVMIGGLNPVYSAPADLKFAEKLAKVNLSVYHGLYHDETAYSVIGVCRTRIPSKAGAMLARSTGPSRSSSRSSHRSTTDGPH